MTPARGAQPDTNRIEGLQMVKTARTIDIEPIERLEEKVKLLVGMLERLKKDAARLADIHSRHHYVMHVVARYLQRDNQRPPFFQMMLQIAPLAA